MKKGGAILIIAMLISGCVAQKIVTVPSGVIVKTTAKTTGKIAVGTTKAIIPGGGEKK